jgi:hypothetical protein
VCLGGVKKRKIIPEKIQKGINMPKIRGMGLSIISPKLLIIKYIKWLKLI